VQTVQILEPHGPVLLEDVCGGESRASEYMYVCLYVCLCVCVYIYRIYIEYIYIYIVWAHSCVGGSRGYIHAYIRKCTYMYIICNLHLSTRGGLQMRCGAGICTFVLVKQVNFAPGGGLQIGFPEMSRVERYVHLWNSTGSLSITLIVICFLGEEVLD
jgi:hypothetical protein